MLNEFGIIPENNESIIDMLIQLMRKIDDRIATASCNCAWCGGNQKFFICKFIFIMSELRLYIIQKL